jgi:hypothetical protein
MLREIGQACQIVHGHEVVDVRKRGLDPLVERYGRLVLFRSFSIMTIASAAKPAQKTKSAAG